MLENLCFRSDPNLHYWGDPQLDNRDHGRSSGAPADRTAGGSRDASPPMTPMEPFALHFPHSDKREAMFSFRSQPSQNLNPTKIDWGLVKWRFRHHGRSIGRFPRASRGGSRDALPHSDPTKPSAKPFRDSDKGTSPNSIGMDMPVVGEIMPARVEDATLWTLPGAAWAQSCSGGARPILSKDALRLAPACVLSAVHHF